MNKLTRYIKSKMPSSIFYRFLLIVLLPMILMQSVSLYIFFHRYWQETSEKNINFLVSEIYIINQRFNIEKSNGIDIKSIVNDLNTFSNIKVSFIENQGIKENKVLKFKNYKKIIIFNPVKSLNDILYNINLGPSSFYIIKDNNYKLEIQKKNGILALDIDKNKIFMSRIDLMIFWNFISFVIMSSIAIIFIKNQIKSIKSLKDFANDFSYLEKENSNFKPKGAKEIREMGSAFLNVVKKMKNFMNIRTTMLAQISHDLRTPLTRMKLQVEFIDDENISNFIKQDLNEMEKMINEYLLFAKGESQNDFKQVNIEKFFNNIIEEYKRSGYENIRYYFDLISKNTYLKVDYFKRCINNLINNSLRYGNGLVEINIKTTNNVLIITVEDNGSGVSEEMFKKIKLPFYKNSKKEKSGVGLGLSIVQSVVSAHRGRINFDRSKKLGGLSVDLMIPLIKNKKVIKYE